MSIKSCLLLSAALVAFTASPLYAEGQHVSIDGNAVHIENGQQQMHIDLKHGGVQIDNDADEEEKAAPAASGADFTNAELTGQSFAAQELIGANFTNATLKNISFRNANLQNADFTNADLTGCDFRGANVSGANFTNASFGNSFIKGVDFSHATMTNADMNGADQTSFIPTSSESIARSLTVPTEKGKAAFVNLSITFDFDKADVTPEGAAQVKELATALQTDMLAASKLMIEGHTDSKGSDDYNLDLSKRRAQAVVALLSRDYGVAPSRLQAVGYGEMRPVAGNDTDFGRAQNRRVTIINLGK